jgi:hypothetical protein
MTIPSDELTFDNEVERYQRCHVTEWGATSTLSRRGGFSYTSDIRRRNEQRTDWQNGRDG